MESIKIDLPNWLIEKIRKQAGLLIVATEDMIKILLDEATRVREK